MHWGEQSRRGMEKYNLRAIRGSQEDMIHVERLMHGTLPEDDLPMTLLS